MQKDEFLEKFGNHLKKLREDRNLTKRELAFRIGKDKSALQCAEWGGNVSLVYLKQIANGLEVSLSELLSFDSNEEMLEK